MRCESCGQSTYNALGFQNQVNSFLVRAWSDIRSLTLKAAKQGAFHERFVPQAFQLCASFRVAFRRGKLETQDTTTVLAGAIPDDLLGPLVTKPMIRTARTGHLQPPDIFQRVHIVHCLLQQRKCLATNLDSVDLVCDSLPP